MKPGGLRTSIDKLGSWIGNHRRARIATDTTQLGILRYTQRSLLNPTTMTPSRFARAKAYLLYLLLTAVLAVSLAALYSNLWQELPPRPHSSPNNSNLYPKVSLPKRSVDFNFSSIPTQRSTTTPNGARVACWPTTGGIWIKHALPIEVDFLYLSRTNDTARPIPSILQITRPGNARWDDPDVHFPPPVSDEDLFCEKMRMVGADFWELSSAVELNGTPMEYVRAPKYRNELGFWFGWPQAYMQQAYMVNLTEAFEKFGPNLKGYNNVSSIHDRLSPVKELGGISCDCCDDYHRCSQMWCQQYPSNCQESTWLRGIGNASNRWAQYGWKWSKYVP